MKKTISGILLSATLLGAGLTTSSSAMHKANVDNLKSASDIHTKSSKIQSKIDTSNKGKTEDTIYTILKKSITQKQTLYNQAMDFLTNALSNINSGEKIITSDLEKDLDIPDLETVRKKYQNAKAFADKASKIFLEISEPDEANKAKIISLSADAELSYLDAKQEDSLNCAIAAKEKFQKASQIALECNSIIESKLLSVKSLAVLANYAWFHAENDSTIKNWENAEKLFIKLQKEYANSKLYIQSQRCTLKVFLIRDKIKEINQKKIKNK